MPNKIYNKHVLISIDSSTLLAGARQVEKKLVETLKKEKLSESIKVIETGSLGLSDQGVVLVVYPEGVHYVHVTEKDVEEIVRKHLKEGEIVDRLLLEREPEVSTVSYTEDEFELEKQARIVLKNCGIINPEDIDEYIALEGYSALGRVLADMKPQDVIGEMKKSELRGRGGAGFPLWFKWNAVKNEPETPKYIVCNADEGEPGTFKDRLILEGDPHRIIEAMIIAGYVTGSHHGYIYIRGEYELSINRMERAISQAYKYNLLGENIFESDFSFDLQVKKGAGSYVCGEETALLESLEGKRATPRHKPPFPTEKGLWWKPTIINNVETLANVPDIILNGGNWFRGYGTEQSAGTKVYTILGHLTYPGLIEVEMGTTLRDIIYKYGGGISTGRQFKAALIGGAAGAFLDETALDIRLSYEDLGEYDAVLGSGAILVMDESACMIDILGSTMRFFQHESCGQCSPCRVGYQQLTLYVDKIAQGKGEMKDLDDMLELASFMNGSAICALGQSAYLSVSSILRYFRKEFEEHITDKKCKAGICSMSENTEKIAMRG